MVPVPARERDTEAEARDDDAAVEGSEALEGPARRAGAVLLRGMSMRRRSGGVRGSYAW